MKRVVTVEVSLDPPISGVSTSTDLYSGDENPMDLAQVDEFNNALEEFLKGWGIVYNSPETWRD